MKFRLPALAIAILVGSAGVAMAHHSMARYDAHTKMTIVGKVTEFKFTNPHTWLYMAVKDPKTGSEVVWAIETNGTAGLSRRGWSRNTFKAGDEVSALINPVKDGTAEGAMLEVTLNGKVFRATGEGDATPAGTEP